MHVKNVCVQIYKYGYGRERRHGTVPEGATHQAGTYPTGKRGGKPVTGVYLKTRCGGSHLPVPACRHTVMQSMSACLTLDTLKPGEEVRAPEAVRPTLSK